MELCLELNPDRYLIVLGPQFATTLLSQLDYNEGPTLSYCDIVHAGIGVAAATMPNEADRTTFERLHKTAYELDPLFAYIKVSAKLRSLNLYDQWLRKSFECPPGVSSTDSLQHLLELQKKGALLVYTHCDDTLDRAASLPPVLLEDAASWAKGEVPGFLHVHGIYSKPSSVKLDYDFYDNSSHPYYEDGRVLCEYLKGRRALCIGFDSHRGDPLQAKFLESLGRSVDPHHQHMIITSAPIAGDSFLTLHAPIDMKNLECVLSTVAGSSQALWNQIEFPSNHVDDCLVISLLVAGKQGCSDISSMMFKAPGVNFALISPLSYGGGHVHTVLIRVQMAQLQNLWSWIFATENSSLVAKGLVGVALKCGTIIWIRGRPPPPVNSAGFSTKEECANSLLRLSESSPRRPDDTLNETLMKSLLLSKSTALAPPPLTRIPNLLPNEGSNVVGARSAQPYCTSSQKCNGGVKVEPDDDPQGNLRVQELSKTLMYRRGSLPPQLLNRPAEDGRTSPFASQGSKLAPGVPLPPESRMPYILKARLLENGRKRNSLATGDGSSALKNLLQSKSAPAVGTFQRRKSDPGTQSGYQDIFARRKELFVNESKMWSESMQRSMERKMKRSREKKQRSSPLLQGDKQRDAASKPAGSGSPAFSSSPVLPLSQPVISVPISNAASAKAPSGSPAPAMVLQARFPPGINPYMFPQPIVAVSSASSASPSVLYNPMIPAYTFVNAYHPAAQAPAYIIPPNSAGRKVVYFMPSSNPSMPVTNGDGNVTYPSVGLPMNISGLVGPVPTAAVKTLPSPTNQRNCNQVLSALLKNPNPVDRDSSDPETPPPAKRKRSGDSSATSEGSQYSPVISTDLRMLLEKQNLTKARDQEMMDEGVQSPVAHTGNIAPAPLTSEVANGQQVQLWQFLLELLTSNSQLIKWTGQELEFQISQPDKVAELWGKVRNDPKMTYQKLAKGLCYYYTQGILKSVPEKLLTFRYTSWLKNYISDKYAHKAGSANELVVME